MCIRGVARANSRVLKPKVLHNTKANANHNPDTDHNLNLSLFSNSYSSHVLT